MDSPNFHFFLAEILRPIIVDAVDDAFDRNLKRHANTDSGELDPDRYTYGISGLADLLHCSLPTAQKIKNSGKIPYSQSGRKLVFEKDAVLRALNHPVKTLRRA